MFLSDLLTLKKKYAVVVFQQFFLKIRLQTRMHFLMRVVPFEDSLTISSLLSCSLGIEIAQLIAKRKQGHAYGNGLMLLSQSN